ncbi:MAG: hypothetical protein NC321_16275 [Clostridium sp.]|nr:hypothetical protein [Clostridium sp.]
MHKLSRKIICIMCSLFIILNTMKVEGNGEVPPSEKNYCSINDFEDFHYYLFCNTNIGTTAPVNPTVNAFIGNGAETMEAGIELYQKFMEPFWECGYEEYMELHDISPGCQLVITKENVKDDDWTNIWRFFTEKKEKERREADIRDHAPFRIIKSGDAYMVTDGERFDEKVDKLYKQTEYRPVKFNEQGNLAAGRKIQHNELNHTNTWEMAICDLESAEVWLTFYQGEQYNYVWQIQGDKDSGKVVYQLGGRDFYEYAYPSGKIKYLGRDMYYPCYSPDGKYIAYSSPDMESCYDLDDEEADEVLRILPGIYILEVETGKTAYIKQDISAITWADGLSTRTFQWVEKDCFEQVMEEMY